MKTIKDFNFQGKKALVRVDFNVPLDKDFNVTDTTRLKAAKPTIIKILEDGGAAVLMSHLGRPKGVEDQFSLRHIVKTTSDILGVEVKFVPATVGAEAEAAVAALEPGEVLLLENLRFFAEETKGDVAFSEQLSKLGDVYVNDAFGTAHRAHASTTIVAQFFKDKLAGFVIEAELVNADKVLKGGVKPVTAIMGGAKVSDKILIIEKLLDVADNIIIGGGMSYTFAKAEGGSIGNSLCQNDLLDYVLELEEKAKAKGVKLIFPIDNLLGDDFSNTANTQVVLRGNIPDNWEGFDIGPQTIELFSKIIKESKTVIWNGPMGVSEIPLYATGTIEVAKAVKAATENGAFSLIGGGDSAAAINNLGFGDDVSYVSTGGGALLEYMEGKTLPGIAALMEV
ncbi:phosphoglycerate kinase [Wenyingzhuangia heitensis]|uniref:Phosphoglycerate kinase n=1 Tax=Wenyingzhuangia heitensis TaxID=1487859 RepID=A0ABX0U4S5_9FLAO|nr:phosphoglycerate kinase [Wenyingzhuangia heitensis]NIJ43867.1 phosphoglycerate kinase [Wenyingzhuangia heitensis]